MLIIVTVLVIVVGVLWLWKPAWLFETARERVPSRVTQITSKVTETTKETVARTGARLGKVRLPFRNRPDLVTQVREWTGRAELERRTALYKSLPGDAAEFTAWLQGLADEDLGNFVQELSAFCTGQGFELDWLVDPKVTGELKRAMEETVGLYCLTVWKCRDLQPFVAYRAWLADPGKKENQAFAQRLYSRLIAAGLATAKPDLWWAPEQERQAYVAQAMEDAAAQDSKSFVSLLRDVAAEVAAEDVAAKSAKQSPPAEGVAPAAAVAA